MREVPCVQTGLVRDPDFRMGISISGLSTDFAQIQLTKVGLISRAAGENAGNDASYTPACGSSQVTHHKSNSF